MGFCKAPNLASINNLDTSTDENDEDWLTEECIECALDENVNDSCNSKLSKLYKKHLPQKYKDVTPGFILPVEVSNYLFAQGTTTYSFIRKRY